MTSLLGVSLFTRCSRPLKLLESAALASANHLRPFTYPAPPGLQGAVPRGGGSDSDEGGEEAVGAYYPPILAGAAPADTVPPAGDQLVSEGITVCRPTTLGDGVKTFYMGLGQWGCAEDTCKRVRSSPSAPGKGGACFQTPHDCLPKSLPHL